MKLKLSRLHLLNQLHDLLKYTDSKPILITSKPYIEFMERQYGDASRVTNTESE